MTKAELVEEVARAAELTKKDSEVIVEEVFKNIIVNGRDTANLDICIRLRAAGLIKGNFPNVAIKNNLYERYFRDKLQID